MAAELVRLCALSDIPEGRAKGLECDGQRLFAVRKGGQVFLYRNRCPHRGLPLEWLPDQFLDSSGSMILCSAHGALFSIEEGQCLAGPCPGTQLEALPIEIRRGSLYLHRHSLGDAPVTTPPAGLPPDGPRGH